jgi:hypothetical protein
MAHPVNPAIARLQARKQYLDQQESSMKVFITDFGYVITAMYNKNKRDADVMKIKDGYQIIRNENPKLVMEMAGPYLWNYREEIKGRKESFFLNNDFKKELAEAQKSGVAEMTDFEDLPAIIGKMKRTWNLFTAVEKETIWGKVTSMLSQYASYVAAQKELDKLK